MEYQAKRRIFFVLLLCVATVIWAVYNPQKALVSAVIFAVAGTFYFVTSLVDWKNFASTRIGNVLIHPIAITFLLVALTWVANFGMQIVMPKGATKAPMNIIAVLTSVAVGYLGIRDWLSKKK